MLDPGMKDEKLFSDTWRRRVCDTSYDNRMFMHSLYRQGWDLSQKHQPHRYIKFFTTQQALGRLLDEHCYW